MTKAMVITGANSGIGYQAAVHFARKGEKVIMACRNMEKAERARTDLLAEAPDADVLVLPLDVSEPGSIEEFVRLLGEQVGELDILINNAGIAAVPLQRNSVGHESQLATNYLGAFALTGLLLPLLRQGGDGRIVNVGSLAHRFGKLTLDDLNWETTPYNEWKSYANSKLAVMCYTLELSRRLRERDCGVVALGAHPGFANTNIHQNSPTLQKRNQSRGWLSRRMQSIVPSPSRAARPIILAAEEPGVGGGEYFGPGGILETGILGKLGNARINSRARDAELAATLWEKSEEMTGVRYLSE